MKMRQAATALLVFSVPLAACASDDAGSSGAGKSETITMKMTDNAFEPENVTVFAGEEITFEFVNDGSVVHEALIGDEQDQEDHEAEMESMGDESMDMGDEDKVQVEPGETGELTMTFDEPGTVLIGCHQPGHYASGMKATVTVT